MEIDGRRAQHIIYNELSFHKMFKETLLEENADIEMTNTECFSNESTFHGEILSLVWTYSPSYKVKNVMIPNQQISILFHETMEFEQQFKEVHWNTMWSRKACLNTTTLGGLMPTMNVHEGKKENCLLWFGEFGVVLGKQWLIYSRYLEKRWFLKIYVSFLSSWEKTSCFMNFLEILKISKKRNTSIINEMHYSFRLNRPNIYTCIGDTRRLHTMLDIELFGYDPYPQLIHPVSRILGLP